MREPVSPVVLAARPSRWLWLAAAELIMKLKPFSTPISLSIKSALHVPSPFTDFNFAFFRSIFPCSCPLPAPPPPPPPPFPLLKLFSLSSLTPLLSSFLHLLHLFIHLFFNFLSFFLFFFLTSSLCSFSPSPSFSSFLLHGGV